MTDKYLLEHGYRSYNPIPFDSDIVVLRFQKRFDDNFGKKYFINVLKNSQEYIPKEKRGDWWKPFSYTYEIQVTSHKDEKAINLEFFSEWTLPEVEKFVDEMFSRMKLNYYESWNEERGVRPDGSECV